MKYSKMIPAALIMLALAGCTGEAAPTADTESETILTDISGETTAETTTEETTETAAETTTELTTETTTETTTEAAETAAGYSIEYNYISPERSPLSEALSAGWSDENMISEIDSVRSFQGDEAPDSYSISVQEYTADFDGDGDDELFAYRSVRLDEVSQWSTYRELWYTDGTECELLSGNTGRGAFWGMVQPEGGCPVIYILPEISMGANLQYAVCFACINGSPVQCEPPEGFEFYSDTDSLYLVSNTGNAKEFLDAYLEAYNSGTLDTFQKLGWSDGRLEMISGYGAE